MIKLLVARCIAEGNMNADRTKHTHQNHYGGGSSGGSVVKTYHSVENIFYERGSELEEWQLRHTGAL